MSLGTCMRGEVFQVRLMMIGWGEVCCPMGSYVGAVWVVREGSDSLETAAEAVSDALPTL